MLQTVLSSVEERVSIAGLRLPSLEKPAYKVDLWLASHDSGNAEFVGPSSKTLNLRVVLGIHLSAWTGILLFYFIILFYYLFGTQLKNEALCFLNYFYRVPTIRRQWAKQTFSKGWRQWRRIIMRPSMWFHMCFRHPRFWESLSHITTRNFSLAIVFLTGI